MVDAVAADCASGQSLPGVKAVLSSGPAELHQMTGPTGRLRLYLDVPPGSRATLTLERSGYRSRSWALERQPGQPTTYCLQRLPSPD